MGLFLIHLVLDLVCALYYSVLDAIKKINMTDILIRDIDPTTLKAIEAMAANNHLSLEEQARELIVKHTPKSLSLSEKIATANRIRAMTPKGVKQTDSVLLIREDRDR